MAILQDPVHPMIVPDFNGTDVRCRFQRSLARSERMK